MQMHRRREACGLTPWIRMEAARKLVLDGGKPRNYTFARR